MAIYFRCHKVAEAEREVTYEYGHPEMDRYLTIDKVEGTALVDPEDSGAPTVFQKIARRAATENQGWPIAGLIQS